LAYETGWLCHHQTTSYELDDRNSFGGKRCFAVALSLALEPTHPLIQWLREITCVHQVPTFRTRGAFLYFSVYRHRVTLNNVNAIIRRFIAHIIPEGTQTMVFPLFIFRPSTFETILIASSSVCSLLFFLLFECLFLLFVCGAWFVISRW
jgi:hypothetical protein